MTELVEVNVDLRIPDGIHNSPKSTPEYEATLRKFADIAGTSVHLPVRF